MIADPDSSRSSVAWAFVKNGWSTLVGKKTRPEHLSRVGGADGPRSLVYDSQGLLRPPFQGMQAIARRCLQVTETGSQVDVFQTPDGPAQEVGRKPFRLARQGERLRVLVGKIMEGIGAGCGLRSRCSPDP
jgi:hypothetical protein